MNEITTVFTTIGDYFRNADWFQLVKWPFWTLLFTVAFGGIYCARFGKKTLINHGIIGTLNLITIYFAFVMLDLYLPPFRDMFQELPFLSVTETGVGILNPLVLATRDVWPLLLRLLILCFMINLSDSFLVGGKTILSWLLTQLVSALAALLGYQVIIAGLSLIFPGLLKRYAFIPVLLIVIVGLLLLICKLIFTVIISEGNPYFSNIYKFFTTNKFGSILTTSSLSFLIFLLIAVALNAFGCDSLNYADANLTGLWIIMVLVLAVLYIFSMYYHDRKKA